MDPDAVVRVFQIGDSHVQGATFADEFRRIYQGRHGDAGRGLVFPHRAARTNGAQDLSWTAPSPWLFSNGLRRVNPMPWGLAQWSLASPDSTRTLRLTAAGAATAGSLQARQAWVLGEGVRLEGATACDSLAPTVRRCALPSQTDSFHVQLPPFPSRFDGLLLENGRPGVVWSESGVNGLAWKDLSRPSRLWEQLHAWNPDLVVVSLGTNDAFLAGFSPHAFEGQVQEAIHRIRLAAPEADILVTMPPDHALRARRRRWRNNPHLDQVEAILRRVCRGEGIPVVELRRLQGGANSWKSWIARGLMAKDHVHYTHDGYRHQARLIHAAMEALDGGGPDSKPVSAPSPEETRVFLRSQDSLVRHAAAILAGPPDSLAPTEAPSAP
jgi:lysophospholipase L1-like esterase